MVQMNKPKNSVLLSFFSLCDETEYSPSCIQSCIEIEFYVVIYVAQVRVSSNVCSLAPRKFKESLSH